MSLLWKCTKFNASKRCNWKLKIIFLKSLFDDFKIVLIVDDFMCFATVKWVVPCQNDFLVWALWLDSYFSFCSSKSTATAGRTNGQIATAAKWLSSRRWYFSFHIIWWSNPLSPFQFPFCYFIFPIFGYQFGTKMQIFECNDRIAANCNDQKTREYFHCSNNPMTFQFKQSVER